MRDAAAAIVTNHGKTIEAEMLHHFNLIKRHRALRIVGMIFAIGRLAAVAVSAKVGSNHRVLSREFRSDNPPGDVRLRCAVQQQKRRPLPANDAVDRGARRLDLERFEARKETAGAFRLRRRSLRRYDSESAHLFQHGSTVHLVSLLIFNISTTTRRYSRRAARGPSRLQAQ